MSVTTRLPAAFLVLIGALAALGPFSIDLYLPAFDAIAADLGATQDDVQGTLSAYFVGLAVGQLVVGPISDRVGRRAPLLVGLVLYVLASLGCALATDVGGLAAWRGLQALGACAGLVASRAILRDRFEPRDMARALSMVMLVMGLAPILAPLVGAFVEATFGWRYLFLGLAAYASALFVAVGFGLEESLATPVARTPRQVAVGMVGLLRVPAFTRYALAGGLAQAAMFVYIGSSSFVFIGLHGLSSTAYAMLFGMNATGLIAASQLNERWLRRTSPERIIPRVLAVQIVASFSVLVTTTTGIGGVYGVAGPLFFAIASLGFCLPNATAAAMAPVGDRAGMAAALLGTLQYGLAGGATFLVSLSFDGTARPMALGMTIASVSAGLALWAFATPDCVEERRSGWPA